MGFIKGLFVFLGVTLTAGLSACGVAYSKNDEFKELINTKLLKIEQQAPADTTEKDLEIESLKAQLEDKNLEITETQSLLEAATSEKTALQTQKQTLETRVAELEASLEASEGENEEIAADLAEAQAELETVNAQITEKDTEITNLTTQVSTLTAEKTALENEVEELQTRVEELENQLIAYDTSTTLSLADASISSDKFGSSEATYALNLDLNKKTFLSYDKLNDNQKALIPAFDEAQKYVTSAGDVVYNFNFDGVYFVNGENFTIAIIRLNTEATGVEMDSSVNSDNHYYMVNFAIKDMYLTKMNARTFKNGASEFDMMKYYTDSLKEEQLGGNGETCIAGCFLESNAITYFDESPSETRTVDYISAGYDGGMVFVSDYAQKMQIDFEFSNAYKVTHEGYYIAIGDTLSLEGVTITVISANSIKIKAKTGYTILYCALSSCYESDGAYVDLKSAIYEGDMFGLPVRQASVTHADATHIRIASLVVGETRSKLSIYNESGGYLSSIAYFHGYATNDKNIVNPAVFGFDGFSRKSQINTPTKEGYKFIGYFIDDVKVVDENGYFIEGSHEFPYPTGSTLLTYKLTPQFEEILVE